MSKPDSTKPVVRVKPHSDQPSKAEFDEHVSVDATPEEIRDALMRSIRIIEDIDA